jgi:hypothetical protein
MQYALPFLQEAGEAAKERFGQEAIVFFSIPLAQEDAALPGLQHLPRCHNGDWDWLTVIGITEPPQGGEAVDADTPRELKHVIDACTFFNLAAHARRGDVAWLIDEEQRRKLAEALNRWTAYSADFYAQSVVAAKPSQQVTKPEKMMAGDKVKADMNAEAPGGLAVMLSAPDLARALGQPLSRVESFLRRHRQAAPDCFIETPDRRSREPHYLYRTADVWPTLQKQMQKWEKLTNE